MSSIYKKSRDGYYYYQTYVYDNRKKKTKKKYHSLKTKDYELALKKKHELDLIYNTKNKPLNRILSFKDNGLKFYFVTFFILAIFIFVKIYLSSENSQVIVKRTMVSEGDSLLNSLDSNKASLDKDSSIFQNKNLQELLVKDTSIIKKPSKVVVPIYSIKTF